MRVVPMALLMAVYWSRGKMYYDIVSVNETGAEVAAVNHKHPLAFLPAAMLTHFIYRQIRPDETDIKKEEKTSRKRISTLSWKGIHTL